MTAQQSSVGVGEIFGATLAVGRRSWMLLAAFTLVMGGLSVGLPSLMDENLAMVVEMTISFALGYGLLWKVMQREGLVRVDRWQAGIGAYIVASILVSAAVVLGMVLLVLPGLILGARWYLVMPLVIGRGEGAGAALSESWRLTATAMWRIVGFLFTVCAVFFVVFFVLGVFAAFDEMLLDTQGPVGIVLAFASYAVSGLISCSSVGLLALLADPQEKVAEVFA